jgi:hypothetical protein
MIDEALAYQRTGFGVIPAGSDKKALDLDSRWHFPEDLE